MTATINIKTDAQLKKQAGKLFADLGMNMTSALNLFLRQAVREKRIPFEVADVPNAVTRAAMRESERMLHDPNTKYYTDLDEMWRDIEE